ncbi:tyrosine-protein phosphatase [Arthrobacter sp. H5]|uniref:tyrosine-protein phosphatase n=1 Tax=Arthrobacter sp. H5 TaxID=1267973 RepID=UPI0004B5E0CA|nr:tyrosine-protein phosphatase [Arthrobacter sp. H5]
MASTANMTSMDRRVHWDGAVNARDLGGISGIARGRLYRMGRHEWLTEAGWQHAYDDGVRTVVDLRNPAERGRREGDPVLNRSVLDRFTVLNRPTEDQSDAALMSPAGYLNSPEYYRENLLRWPEKIAAVFRGIGAAPAGAVVVHCAAGRDRTGLVTTILLSLAGVPDDEIAADYALGVHGINDHHRLQAKPREKPKSDDELRDWVEDARGHLLRLLADFDGERYLLDAGMSVREVAAVRARLTS